MVESADDFETSQSFGGRRFPNFEMRDAKIASSLKQIIQNSNFNKSVNLAEQTAQMEDRSSPWKTDCVHDLRILPGNW